MALPHDPDRVNTEAYYRGELTPERVTTRMDRGPFTMTVEFDTDNSMAIFDMFAIMRMCAPYMVDNVTVKVFDSTGDKIYMGAE